MTGLVQRDVYGGRVCGARDDDFGARHGHSLANMVRHARQKVVPHLSYEDPFTALAWLCRVFGFTEAKRSDRGEDNLTARLLGVVSGIFLRNFLDMSRKPLG